MSRDQLFNLVVERIGRLHSYGVGTIEVKSGYGLNFEKEYEIANVINDLKKHFKNKIQIINTYMAAHADEFYDNKGAILATKYGALSTDHLLRTTDDGILALSNSRTVATLLPGTGFFLGKEQANARALLDAGVKVAIGSDYNPGSCHCDNLLLIASLAAPQYKMNITELWCAITINAAHALGLKKQGAIMKGLVPRLV